MSFTAAAASTPGTARSCGPPPGGEMWRGWCLVNYGIQSRGLIFHDTLISCSRAWCPAADAVATLATFYYSCRSHEVRKCHVSRVTRGGRVTRVPALFCHHLGTRHQYTSHFYLGLTGVEEVRCDWVSLPDFSDFSVPCSCSFCSLTLASFCLIPKKDITV